MMPQILLRHDEDVPLGVQLKTQLKYLINTMQLPGGAMLPPIRNLARELNLSPGTVAQVYRELQLEGLVRGEQGRGTFVHAFPAAEEEETRRRLQLLDETLVAAVDRAYALNIDSATVRQHLLAIMGNRKRRLPVAIVFPKIHAARKYAQRLETAFSHVPLTALPVELAALQEGETEALQALTEAYYVVTLAIFVPQVEQALELQRRSGSVIGITASVTDETLQRLQSLPAEGNYALLTEERNMFSFLNTIQNESSIDYRTVRRLSLESAPDLRSIAPQLDALLYTLGGQEAVDEQAVPPSLRCPINFEISRDSLHRLNSLFGQATVPGS